MERALNRKESVKDEEWEKREGLGRRNREA